MDNNPEKELSPAEEKRGRGRPSGFRMTEEHRIKISNAKILNRLIEGFNGQVELTPGQIQIGLKLIDKVLPSLQSTTLEGNPENPVSAVLRIERVIVGS